MLFSTIAVLTVFVSQSVHELGHAYAMRECRVRIIAISLLGLPVEGWAVIKLPINHSFFPGIEWRVHPLSIVGAYVECEEEDVQNLSRADQLYVHGMGPLAAVLFALFTTLVLSVLVNFLNGFGIYPGMELLEAPYLIALPGVIVVIWRGRRLLCKYALPISTLTFFAYVGMLIVEDAGIPIITMGETLEMIGSISPIGTEGSSDIMHQVVLAMIAGTVMSILINAGNLFGFVPLDGGRIVQTVLPVWAQSAYAEVTIRLLWLWLSLTVILAVPMAVVKMWLWISPWF